MRSRERMRSSLTNRLLILGAVIVVSTTLLLTATMAIGVYQMAGQQQSSREAAYRDILVTELGAHLYGAQAAVAAARQPLEMAAADPVAYRQVMSGVTLSNAGFLEGMTLLGVPGTQPVEWPPDTGLPQSVAPAGSAESSSAAEWFTWDSPGGKSGAGTLWVLTPVKLADGTTGTLVGHVRMQSIERALKEIERVREGLRAVVFDGRGAVLFPASSDVLSDGDTIEFIADSGSSGSGGLHIEGSRRKVGSYAEVASPEGLGWRVAVIEPASTAWTETLSALRPGILGWLIALALSLLASLVVVSKVTAPLRALERRARALAHGASVQTETVMEHDEVGRLLEAFNSVARRLNRLNDVAELLARASDRSMVLSGITASIVHMLGSVDAEVLLLESDDSVRVVAAEGVLAGKDDITLELAETPWIGLTIRSGHSRVTERAAGDPFFELHGEDATSALAAPLQSGSETIGLAVVVRHGAQGFSSAEAETVRSFAAQASVALQNARLFEDERNAREDAEWLRKIAERAAAAGTIDETLLEIATMESDLVGGGRPLVVLRDHSRYGSAPPADPPAERVWFAAWEQAAPADEERADAVYLDLASASPAVARALRMHGVSGALMTPLHRASELAGFLVLLAEDGAAAPSALRMGLARTVGRQASLALENAYLYQQAKSRADNLETIFRISHAVGSSLQTRIVLNRVLDVVQKILSADAVMLMTYDQQRKHIAVPMARGILNREMLDATFRPGEDVPGRVFETREPERYDRISTADTQLLNAAAGQGLESLLAVPLLARGRSIGVLVVFSRSASAFSTDDLDLLRTFASQAALSIDTAEMFSREHNVATTLQESILPTRLPRIPGIEASSVYMPAGTDSDIGGDYYDMFVGSDGRVIVSIGDVCGKGVSAATKTSMIRYALRGMVIAGLGPARVMAELNAMLLEIGDPTSIVTLWLGYIDTAAGVLTYSDGGHPPALLMRPDSGRIERLGTTGALLGAVADTSWSEQEVVLAPGSALLLYTDGVTEARSGQRFFGEGRVRRALRAGGSASSVAQRLLSQLQRFSAGELRDDAAILAITVGSAEPGPNGVSAFGHSGK